MKSEKRIGQPDMEEIKEIGQINKLAIQPEGSLIVGSDSVGLGGN